MSNFKFTLNRAGVKELLQSGEVQEACMEHANETVRALGTGYESSLYIGRTRANVSVRPVTPKAINENAKHNTLLKALR